MARGMETEAKGARGAMAWAVMVAAACAFVACGAEDMAPDVPPTPEEVAEVVQVDGDPGRVTLHRLNRAEYNHTVRDLLGTSLTPADDFPHDDHGYGFDNIADVLSVSPLLFELYEHAAEQLVEEALFAPETEPTSFHFEAEDDTLEHTVGGANGDSGWNLWSNGEVIAVVDAPVDGTYRVRVRAFGQQAGDALAEMSLTVDGVVHAEFLVEGLPPEIYEAEVPMEAGLRQVGVGFVNDFYIPGGDACVSDVDCASGACGADGLCQSLDRNLVVDWFDVYGPLELEETDPVNPQREAIMVCDPAPGGEADCAREILSRFGQRAWRRPLQSDELDALLGFLDVAAAEGDGWEEGVRWALQAMLVSPHFLFRVELDADPEGAEPHPLTDWELASRLSYFLWSSMPDAALFAAAEAGELRDPEVLAGHVTRMLADPRAQALVESFGGQWLYWKALDDVIPDPWVFPGWSEELRASMRAEAWLFFHSFVQGERDMRELLDGDDTFVDAALASHYGMDGFFGPPGSFLQAQPAHRGGVLRQGAWLTALSYPTRTSPVKRGKWVLGQLLCREPEPPPPGVDALDESALAEGALTIREILEVHRADPACAACHLLMDPIGLAFESYDGTGRWRTEEHGLPVDPSGEIPGGESFAGAAELLGILAAEPDVPRCMAEKLLTYGLGRGIEASDAPFIEGIVAAFAEGGYHFDDLATAIALSPVFQTRRGEPATSLEEAP